MEQSVKLFKLMNNFVKIFMLAFILSSCVSHEELITFHGVDFSNLPGNIANENELIIQPEDLLRITVHSYNLEAAKPFNFEQEGRNLNNQLLQAGNTNGNTLELFMGYLVDDDGYIDLPVIGSVLVQGMTITQAKEKLLELIKPLLADAVINMRLLNFKITVLGEVNAPGTIRLTNKRLTLLEAIGMAGDFSQYANRKNILLIREKFGERNYIRLNLQSNDIFSSPYFYLEQNDVIYIEPIRARIATVSDPAQRAISYSSAALSLITLIVALFTR